VDGKVRRLGLDLGGTDIKLALLEDDVVVGTATAPTRSEDGPEAVLRRVAELGRTAGEVDSICLSVPGLLDEGGRALLFPNLHGDWVGIPVAEPLAAAFGRPVPILNDGHAFALAEARLGAAREANGVIAVVCGTGVGGGLVLGGQLWPGLEGRAGHIGHHTVAPEGALCGCGNRGCLETIAGARAIAEAAGAQTFTDALAAARAEDETALAAFARAGTFLGIAVANLVLFVSPERVVIGGGVAEAGDLVLEPLRREVHRRAASVAPVEKIEIIPAELGAFAGAIGASLHGATELVGSR
jgi:glucokinase